MEMARRVDGRCLHVSAHMCQGSYDVACWRDNRSDWGTMEERYAVIGESEGYPIFYHMNQQRPSAERQRLRREASIGQSCFIVPMSAWFADPRGALRGVHRETP